MKPNDSEILWRISRAYVDIGEHLAENQQEAYFEKAINYADKAISANPKNAQGYLRKSIALGKLALFKGVFKSISIVKQVKANLDTCLSLNPNEPTGHYVLGRTHHKLCEKPKIARSLLGLGWAEETISEKEYLKAISLDPTFIMYHYDFALLLQELGKKDEADKQFKLILTLPIRDEDDKDLMAKSKAQIK
jgi:tetratricopeptide (TPR) repeat protein